ncbi:AraC family transcriptional regulator [Psychroflexus sp. CAK8W]|uniref:AraC family transcriptional regulator n=1 Tax=Psychroflexus longus TaxID=2873596 RepID=A0ABS7XK15_9FLAO|nr:AraC family transcriptional regulator [Psychroflexus longus]MBZ9778426.1 AraC family transcriptional regulator [Psychroflexus longus]
MKLYIKDMVSLLVEEQVKAELKKLKIPFGIIDHGIVELSGEISQKKHNRLKNNLIPYGLKLHNSNKVVLVEKIKDTIQEMLMYSDGLQVMSYSVYISLYLRHDYTYLANIFSEVNGNTIQQYIIESKIERVKKLFHSSSLNLSEISFLLHYSSVAHLSGQFKKITGLSPSCYKSMMHQRNSILEPI